MSYRRLALLSLLLLLSFFLAKTAIKLPLTVLAAKPPFDLSYRPGHPKPTITPTPTSSSTPQVGNGTFYSNLSGATLTGAYLAYHDFHGFDFSNAILRDTNLIYSNLTGAKLTNTDLTNSDLRGINFSNVDLSTVKWYFCPTGTGTCGATTCPDGHLITTDGASCY